jgi:uncharacterized protein YggE
MRSILLFLFLGLSVFVPAQSEGNYNIPGSYGNCGIPDPPKTRCQPIPGWDCGSRAFTVKSDVVLYVQPDGWVLEIEGTEEAPSLATTRTKIQLRIDAFTKKLNGMGITSENITVTTISQERVQGWSLQPNGISTYTTTGYSITKSIRIRYTNAQLYSRIISEGSLQGFDNITQNYCTVADEQAAYAELYRQAMEVAMEKCDEYIHFYGAELLPGWHVSKEQYNVVTPTPGVYFQPGVQRESLSGYDRAIGSEYGKAAVRYTVHLELAFTLNKKAKPAQPNNVIYKRN